MHKQDKVFNFCVQAAYPKEKFKKNEPLADDFG